jgi:hypothetical protein
VAQVFGDAAGAAPGAVVFERQAPTIETPSTINRIERDPVIPSL